MQDTEKRIEELLARIATLEATVKTGGVAVSENKKKVAYGFVNKLEGEDKLEAQTLIEENAALKTKVDELLAIVEQKDYRIKHLKEAVDKLLPK